MMGQGEVMLPRVNLVRADAADYLLFSTADAISRTIYSTGTWASPMLTISHMFLQDIPAPLVLDIGANLGAYAVPIAKEIAGRSGTVYCYEPQRIVYYQLCGNTVLNRLDNLHAFNMAIGATEGSVQIPAVDYAQSKNIGGFTLDALANQRLEPVAVTEGVSSHEVPMRPLDGIQFPKTPSLIKIDVEGLELQVLRGATQLLHDSQYPPLLLEAWTLDWFKAQRQELLDFLKSLGYVWFAIGDEVIAQHPGYPRQLGFAVDDKGIIQISRLR